MQRIELKNISVHYGAVAALRDVSLNVEPGEFLALLGPSGCGKTTLLRVLGGFVSYEGSVRFGGQPVDDLPAHRREIGIVFQDYALFPHKTVRENIGFGLKMRGQAQAKIRERAEEMLALLRLTGLGDRYPLQLSGGQQQRVALARAIAISPRLLLLDEPLGALDKKLREEMQVELRQLQQRVGITTIFVTHDQEEALSLADRVAVMSQGEVQQIGTTAEVYEAPVSRFVAEFMGHSNFLPARIATRQGDLWQCRTEAGETISVRAAAEATVDQPVTLSVRPERVRLADESNAAINRLRGTIEHVTYLGGLIHVRVRLSSNEVFKIALQNAGIAAGSLVPGRSCALAFGPDDAVALVR